MQFKTLLFLLIPFFAVTESRSQSTRIDSIPFTLNKKLIVFKGNINGVAVDFAFDTGAGVGLSNTAVLSKANFTVKKSEKKVNDANLNTISLSNTVIDKMTIGNYAFSNVKGVLYDTEYLQCNALYLLGMDVIGKLNWRINFKTRLIEVCEQPFSVEPSALALPVKYAGSRPVFELQVAGGDRQKCLIDFGFVGSIELPETAFLNKIVKDKLAQNQATISLSSSMSVGGLAKADTVKYFRIDSLNIGKLPFKNVAAYLSEKTNLKIGVGFFDAYCNQVVLNHKTDTYYLSLNSKQQPVVYNYDCRVSYVGGKLLVTGKSLLPSSTASGFTIGEEIKTINGKTATSYSSNCDFLNFFYQYKEPTFVLEKTNGEKTTISRTQY